MHKVFAESITIPKGSGSETVVLEGVGIDFLNISDVLNKVVPYVFAFAGFGLLLMIVSAGYSFLTSAGNPKGMEMGKQRLTNALIGFAIIFVAYWLVQILGYIFGIEEITTVF